MVQPATAPVCTAIFGLAAIALMQLAKQTREADGVQIPETVAKQGASIANTPLDYIIALSPLVTALTGLVAAFGALRRRR